MKYLMSALLSTALLSGGLMFAPAMAADGGHMMGGMHSGKGGMYHDGWKATLTDDQRQKYYKLKLDYKKQVYPIKAKIKQAKVDLALLIGTDKPNQKSINSKIDEIAKLKAEKMRIKAAHKIEVRKILNEEQRVKFDMKLLKKAWHGKKKGGGYHHGRH